MSLKKLLDISESHNNFKKAEVTEERLLNDIDEIRTLIAFYREYPDLYIEYHIFFLSTARNRCRAGRSICGFVFLLPQYADMMRL